MIVATNLSDTLALKLANICEATKTPLFLVKCLGFTGMFRIQAGEHTSKLDCCWCFPLYVILTNQWIYPAVIETHPENSSDLRLDMPFPTLLDYVKEFDFDNMDSSEHGHVPFVVVLQHYLQLWKSTVVIWTNMVIGRKFVLTYNSW